MSVLRVGSCQADHMATTWGDGAEELARKSAAEFGRPDFVYDPITESKGSATREVSDGLLIVRDRGIILQSKARDPQSNNDPEKLKSWAMKQIDKATKQVAGTRRRLAEGGLELRSRRGSALRLDSQTGWPGVVLIDAPMLPPGIPAVSTDRDTIVMTLDDWSSLNHLIRSSSGVIDYVYRVVEHGTAELELGNEASRYFAFAKADRDWSSSTGGYPAVPEDPISSDDVVWLESMDEWIDGDLASDAGNSDESREDQIRRAIETIDAVPVAMRVVIGRALLDRAEQAESSGEPRTGSMKLSPSNDRLLFFFDTDRNWPDAAEFEAHAFAYAAVRHEELNAIEGNQFTLLLARLGTVNRGAFRVFVAFDGDASSLEIPADVRDSIIDIHGSQAQGSQAGN